MIDRLRYGLAAALLTLGVSGCVALNAAAAPRCSVRGAELLSPEVGGAPAVCAEMARAMAPVARRAVRVEVRILSPSLASGTIILGNGRFLPAVTTSVSDGRLKSRSIRMLAKALALQLSSTPR